MDNTANLQLPYILAAQAQKHVTHNEAVRMLDAIVQLSVLDRDLGVAPAAPVDGDRYIITAGASGDWSGKDNNIAAWQDGAWMFYVPQEGWLTWVMDEDVLLVWDGAVWNLVSSGSGSVNPTPLVGINATADTSNRLSVASPATLFSHSGNGHQLKINKNALADTASSLYQTGFSGRAEMGLTGDDDFHFKVSPDGSAWSEAIVINKDTGGVTFPNTILGGGTNPNILINGDGQINQRGFAGGSLASGNFGFDRWYAEGGAANVSISGRTWTLTSGTLAQKVEPLLWGYDNLASTSITISVEDLSGGSLNVNVGSGSATLNSGSGQRSVSITTATGDTGNLVISLTPSSGVVTFKRIKAEVGANATPWQARPFTSEKSLAERYYERITLSVNERFAVGVVANTSSGHCRFPMRFRQEKPTGSINVALSSTSQFTIDGAGYLDVADGFSILATSASGAYVQFVNLVNQSAGFVVGGTMILANTAGAWIEFDGEI